MTNTATTEGVPEWELRHRLNRAAEVSGLTRRELAEELDVHVNTVHNWMGGNTTPTASDLFHFAAVTGVSYRWLRWGELPSNGSGGPGNNGPRKRKPWYPEISPLSTAA